MMHFVHTVRNLHFLSKNSTLISRENCLFFRVKNSWKCWGFLPQFLKIVAYSTEKSSLDRKRLVWQKSPIFKKCLISKKCLIFKNLSFPKKSLFLKNSPIFSSINLETSSIFQTWPGRFKIVVTRNHIQSNQAMLALSDCQPCQSFFGIVSP